LRVHFLLSADNKGAIVRTGLMSAKMFKNKLRTGYIETTIFFISAYKVAIVREQKENG
jgi:hypothetical protein